MLGRREASWQLQRELIPVDLGLCLTSPQVEEFMSMSYATTLINIEWRGNVFQQQECRANIKHASLSAVEVQCECLFTGQPGATHMQLIHLVLLAPKYASAATAAASPDLECPAHGCNDK
jgi:hypothetical protein